ncbi:MAG: O-methyltransferase family protein [Ignavibacteria bacterium]|nr:MAG: O-methyltransferase family protein [Ignavibacteria bacterium]KAF0158574.1 MAG: O-methyltransferase family protein [Ignavibacteria bacterium]
MSSIANDVLDQNKILELANGFQVSRIILTALELNVFTILDKRLLPSSETAKQINCDEHAAERLLNALVSLGFLKKLHGKFYNTDAASLHLVKGSPDFLGGLFHTNELWNSWGTLTNAVKKGASFCQNDDLNNNCTDMFIYATHSRAVKEAKILAMLLNLTSAKIMLDVGGGSGVYSMRMIEHNPELNAVIFDLPNVIPLTKNYVDSFSLKEKINYIEGNYLTDDFESSYDLILLSDVVHINNYEQNLNLIKKCERALNRGGQIVIKDWVMNENRTDPLGGALFALNLLVSTKCGDTYTEKEIRDWFANAGFSKIERINSSYGWALMIGTKN